MFQLIESKVLSQANRFKCSRGARGMFFVGESLLKCLPHLRFTAVAHDVYAPPVCTVRLQADTQDMEDHSFCGMFFDVAGGRCKRKLTLGA